MTHTVTDLVHGSHRGAPNQLHTNGLSTGTRDARGIARARRAGSHAAVPNACTLTAGSKVKGEEHVGGAPA
eukprot:gene10923-biopygen13888